MSENDKIEKLEELFRKYSNVNQYQIVERNKLVCSELASECNITIEESTEIFNAYVKFKEEQINKFKQF